MSRLNLDTTLGVDSSERYSFMETPLEMRPESNQQKLSSPPAADLSAPSQHPQPEEPPKQRQRAWSYEPSEKEEKLQHQGFMPDYTNRPPLEQHPANYAPLVQAQQQQHQPRLHHSASMPLQIYTDTPEQPQHGTQGYTLSYTNLPEQQHHTMSPQSYTNQTYAILPQQYQWNQQTGLPVSSQYANIAEQQPAIPRSPQSYSCANIAEQQHAIPMSQSHSHAKNSYATQPYTNIQQRSIQMSPLPDAMDTELPRSPPGSPGPLPLKVNPDASSRANTLEIAPDANPLQSPKSPYFPPIKSATWHAPPPDDLSAHHQPGQTVHPNQEVKGGGWSNGLCELSSFGICCLGLICPCILYGRTQHRLSMKSKKEDPTNMLSYETCNGSCTAMGLLCGCQCKSWSQFKLEWPM